MKQRISDAESKIMTLIWKQNPITAAEVIMLLKDDNDWEDKTIKTLLNRLLKKGFINHEKVGRHYRYRPAVERETYLKQENTHFLERFYDGKLSPLIASFSRHNKLSEDDVAALHDLIEKMEQNRD